MSQPIRQYSPNTININHSFLGGAQVQILLLLNGSHAPSRFPQPDLLYFWVIATNHKNKNKKR